MTVTQRPDTYSLTSTIKDFIIASSTGISFEVLAGAVSILQESYVPDSSGNIYIRDLGKLFENYLSGELATGPQTEISKTFSFKINNTASGSTTVLYCKAYTLQEASVFFDSKALNLQYRSKVTIPTAREFITFYMTTEEPVQAKVIYLENNVIVESDLETFHTVLADGFETFEITLRKICLLFPDIESSSILGFYVGQLEYYVKYLLDRESYIDARTFIFLNSFGVPETLITRGEMIRKGALSFDSSKIDHVEKRFNIEHQDTFTASIGKVYSSADILLLRELVASELVKCFYKGEYREIVISEVDLAENQRRGAITSAGFTFKFAEQSHNMMLIDSTWALESGAWSDPGDWLDAGPWNDDPEIVYGSQGAGL